MTANVLNPREFRGADFLAGGGEMAKSILSKDWSQTPLGPIDSWPQSLRTTVSLCLASNFPISIAWGPSRVQIYNDGYWVICGDKHPRSMGMDFKECWFSAWPAIGEAFERATRGESSFLENQRMFLDRNGYLEETFFTFSFSPIRDETGDVGGLFHPVTETTVRMLSERRTRMLRELTASAVKAISVEEACVLSSNILAEAALDLPFFLLYVFTREANQARLMGSAGVRAGGVFAPNVFELNSESDIPWLPNLKSMVRDCESHLIDGLEQHGDAIWRGPYPEPPQRALLLPIPRQGANRLAGFLVAGVSPRRALDDSYRIFLELLARHLASALASAQSYEDERHKAEALAELDRAKTAFFSNVSHEFRTPLTLMLGPLEDLLAPGSVADPKTREDLELVYRNSLRLLNLVNTLLDFSRIEAGRIEARYEAVDLGALTADLAATFRSAIDRAGLRLTVECPALAEPAYVDREMWEKIVLNLISNAFKFTFAGEIAVSAALLDQCFELSVSDTGVGIPEPELARIFERFHRIPGVLARTYEGTGIGLALVEELARLHGGSIVAASKLGEGSKFTVTIPRGSAHLPQARVLAASEPASKPSARAHIYADEALRWNPPPAQPEDRAQPAIHNRFAPACSGRILLADDNADMRDYVSRLLSQHYEVQTVSDGWSALQAARHSPPDLVLSDVMMPRLDGFGLLRELRGNPATSAIPVILLSARAGEESKVEGLEAGADDYLIKPFTARELLARVDANVRMARIRRQASALVESESRFRSMADCAPVMIWTCDAQQRCDYLNRGWIEFTGRTPEYSPGWTEDLHPDDLPVFLDRFNSAFAANSALNIDTRVRHRDGNYRWVLCTGAPRFLPGGEFLGYVVTGLDIDERKRARMAIEEANRNLQKEIQLREAMEAQLLQAQKMEAIGRLAGGVAHDFNNLLTVILGYTAAALNRLPPEDPLQKPLGEVRRASQQAASLTGELLAFGRKQATRHLAVELDVMVSKTSGMLRRLIGEHIDVTVRPSAGCFVNADEAQLTQVLMNLAANARDAMPAGGKLTIETCVVHREQQELGPRGVRPEGEYAVLAVRDSGAGMDSETASHIFEPFFTTKDVGKGTGLGLSTVHGIVEQHGGWIEVSSQPHRGTCFKIYLPKVAVVSGRPLAVTAPGHLTRGLNILLVEDQAAIRMLAEDALSEAGHHVLSAANGRAALQAVQERGGTVELLITDVVMPEMSGPELAAALARSQPDLKVLYISGYAGVVEQGTAFLAKPFLPDQLVAKVCELA